jgi:hypothetical protein
MKQEGRTPESFERPIGNARRNEFYVTGSDLVRVPGARANEIPKVIMEHHKLEAGWSRVIANVRRLI